VNYLFDAARGKRFFLEARKSIPADLVYVNRISVRARDRPRALENPRVYLSHERVRHELANERVFQPARMSKCERTNRQHSSTIDPKPRSTLVHSYTSRRYPSLRQSVQVPSMRRSSSRRPTP
jgi:hypothetical protein